MFGHSDYDGSPESLPDFREIVPRIGLIDKGELTSIPKLIKVVVLTAAILAGKTPAEARTAFRQAWTSLS